MSKDLNKVLIIGHLGADPELRFTPQGTPVTTFRVASGRTWKDADSTAHEDTEWFRVVVWNKLAEVCNTHLAKGSRVYIEGRVQTRKWQDQAGQDRYTTEVIVSDVIMLDGRKPDIPTESANPEEDAEAITPSAPTRSRTSATTPSRMAAGNAVSTSRRTATSTRAMARRSSVPEEDLPL
jgi:single-strand DNA-binding protein